MAPTSVTPRCSSPFGKPWGTDYRFDMLLTAFAVFPLALAPRCSPPAALEVEGVAFEAVRQHDDEGVARFRWADHPETSLTMTMVERDGFVAATALLPNGERRQVLSPVGQPLEWSPVPESGSRPCAGAVDGAAMGGAVMGANAPQDGGLAGGCNDGDRVDVLILTTPAARTQAGGTNQLNALCDLAVASSNTAYINTGLAARLRNVLRLEVNYTEVSFSSDLSGLATDGDGVLDEVHDLRDACGADLVALVRTSGEYCGIGYLMPYNDSGASTTGFSVTAQTCLSSQTFAHELGHNMGCCHASGDGGGCTTGGIFSYSVGWRFAGTNGTTYRTVMAYSPGSRIDHFSNPNVSFQGTATGVEPTASVSGAHNARTISETLGAISSYRCAVPESLLGDCDANGTIDVQDIAQGRASDCDGDGVLDSCGLPAGGACTITAPACASGFLLNAPGGQSVNAELFGKSVATDGTSFIVGSPGENSPLPDVGLVEIWKLVNDRPVRQATIRHAPSSSTDQFGSAVAIAGDWAIVGALGRDVAGVNSAGAAYVFRRTGSVWSQVQTIHSSTPSIGGRFGITVALQGSWLAIGAPGEGNSPVGAGAVHLFQQQANGQFTPQQRLVPSLSTELGYFGWSVDLDGSMLVIGAPFASAGAGQVWASLHDGSAWSDPERIGSDLEPIADTDARLGYSVACAGAMVAGGAPQHGDRSGAVFMWSRVGAQWQALPAISGPTQQGARFGHALDMTPRRIIVAQQDFATLASGVRAYDLIAGSTPLEIGRVPVGESVAVTNDLAIIGASESVEVGTTVGAARVWWFSSDCDGNGVADRCQIAQSGGDADGDGLLDACEVIVGDLDGNGVVNGSDLGVLLGGWGHATGDLNGDGTTDGADLGMLLGNWTA